MKFKSGGFYFKEIKKEAFSGKWPFKSDKAVIACKDKTYCIVQLSGKTFALNGAAASKFKLKFAHDTRRAIHGISVKPFIDMAMRLEDA